jgi:phage-related protein
VELMAVFPSITPDHPALKSVKPKEKILRIGDGLEHINRFGLNFFDTEWRLTWKRLSTSERDTIEAFLVARAADGLPFDWTPPDAASVQQFRVDQWAPARTTPTGWALDLTFRRVFETGSAPTLESITCEADIPPVCLSERGGTFSYAITVDPGGADLLFSGSGVTINNTGLAEVFIPDPSVSPPSNDGLSVNFDPTGSTECHVCIPGGD